MITSQLRRSSSALLPALEKALESGWGGASMEVFFSPDYAAYYRTTADASTNSRLLLCGVLWLRKTLEAP